MQASARRTSAPNAAGASAHVNAERHLRRVVACPARCVNVSVRSFRVDRPLAGRFRGEAPTARVAFGSVAESVRVVVGALVGALARRGGGLPGALPLEGGEGS